MITRRVFSDMRKRPDGRGFAFGQHLAMNLYDCPQYVLASSTALADYVAKLVDEIGMVAYGPTRIEHFGHALPQTSGFTVVQMIETSLISGHMVDAERTAWWDVFSCKPFDVDKALALTEEYFNPEVLEWKVLYR
jgi:S-adenosylmethionine/arginine decarboxylase-like enzyme